jgi:D-alanyl-D-alanine carboxypeptidase
MLVFKEKFKAILLSGIVFWSQQSLAECGGPVLNQAIQKLINDARVMHQLPGIQVSLSCPGESAPRDFVSGTTTIDGTTALQPTHLFQIGSETKTYIAAIILQLESEGKLSIYDPITGYLRNLPAAWQSITIQQLLNHTSGIPDYTTSPELQNTIQKSNYTKQWTSDELVSFVTDKSLLFQPSLGWNYSNTNYVLAGKIIEAVTKNPLKEEINNRLFKPLGLSNTYYLSEAYSQNILNRMAHGYSSVGLFPDEPKDITTQNPSWINAAGAIVSTTHDKVLWLRQLITTNKVLPNTQKLELMHLVDIETGQPLPSPSPKPGYGNGMMGIYSTPIGSMWGHGGKTLGYISSMIWLQCSDIVLATNFNRVNKIDIDSAGSRVLIMQLVYLIQTLDPTKKCIKKGILPTYSLPLMTLLSSD